MVKAGIGIGVTVAVLLIAWPGFRYAVWSLLWFLWSAVVALAVGAVVIGLVVLVIWLFRRGNIGIGFWF